MRMDVVERIWSRLLYSENTAEAVQRHCLWILGMKGLYLDGESVWKDLVLDAKRRQCFFNADEDKDLAEFDQLDDVRNSNSMCLEVLDGSKLEVPQESATLLPLPVRTGRESLRSLFYSLSSGVVNHLLSDHEGRELDLPFELADQEMEIVLYRKSSFIVGRSGTGKTTVLTMKLFQNEQRYQLAVQGCVSCQNSMVEQSTSATKGTLHQFFVTVSPKLCFAIKQHVLNLKSFACGGSDSTEKILIDMADFDEGEAQFKDIKDSFHDIPPNSYPLVITFHKFLMMLDGTLGNSYFERFLDATKLTHGRLQSSRSVALQTFIRTKEVKYERFSSSYWPHFNIQLTKKLDASRVFTEIISHIKGGLEAMEAGDGKLNREDYVRLSESRGSNLSKQKREAIYDIFQAYEKMKMKNGEFDLADFVIDLHHRLRHEKYGGDQMDFVYIDESRLFWCEMMVLRKKFPCLLGGMLCPHHCGVQGPEFQDVLLYNFFGSSPLKNQWRVIYDYMKERDLLDSTLPKCFPSFNESKHNILCSELKQLYVAVTRTRQRLWVCESVEELSKPMFDYWKKKCLVQVRQLDDSLAQEMQVASRPEEWKSRGIKLYHEHSYEMATMCFERAGDTYWEKRSKATGLKAIADRMRTSNPEEANSILREAAEIFDAIGKADSAAICFSDLGEYERAGMTTYQHLLSLAHISCLKYKILFHHHLPSCTPACNTVYFHLMSKPLNFIGTARIYLDKYGVPDLERAGECFSLAGCYKDSADVYARGNFFSECLTACAKGKLFEMGLQYIKYWKKHAIKDCVVARRGEEMDEIEQEYLESCASHYYELTDHRSMMNFVKEFHSIILMRNFLKKLGLLDELLLLEEEFGNYLEAAEIAKMKGDILLEADFLGKAGKFREASSHILLYVFANSLWSYGGKGWPIQQFSQKEELLSKAKSFAKKETESFYELVCTEIDILLNEQSNLALIKNYMNVCQRHKRVELLSARKILDAHISSSADKYVWEKDLVDGNLIMCSEGRISENQVSIDSLIYFWIFWKDKIAFIIKYLGCLENRDVNDYRRYKELCVDYLGVWRLYHNLAPVYVLLVSDADWVRGLDERHFRNHGKLVSINVHQLVSAACSYWSSEMLSVGMEVLEKLENLYKFPIKNVDDAVFCQSRCLTHICEISEYLLQSKCLKLRNQDAERLQRYVKLSTDTVVANIFPLDWRNSLRENMIALRRTDALKNALKQVTVEYTSSEKVLSLGQIGRLAMVILGSGKLNNSELYEKLVVKLDCHPPWKAFIENLCGNIRPGNTSEEPREVSIMLKLYGALVDTYNANWRVVRDYISPGCFLYLVERLLIWATCFQGYAITTSSCFVEWLIYQEEDTNVSSMVGVGDALPSLIDISHFVIYVVRECVFNKADMVEWIKKTNTDWNNYHSQLMLRFVVMLCLVYLNFGMGLNELYDLLGRDYITEQLPWEFYDALKRQRRHKTLNINVKLLAAAFQKIGNTLVIASFGSDCSRFLCSDVIFVDMKANHSRDDILRKLIPKQPPVLQVSQATSVEGGETGAASDKTSDDVVGGRDNHNTGEESCISKESIPKPKQAVDVASGSQCGSNETGNKGKKKGKNKKPKKKGGKK
ncbi:unnamed protein product [Prunus armeniaca]|uniref:UvrD-like helicase ATP-binding domain-containing protein n=1 Tax=Prunus armeniaca TaxID=36596 RepID=A0A6J5TJ12_PRUAR|nr:unnamed protein product [Prunus armeniaca]